MEVVTMSVKVMIVDDQESFRSAARLVVDLAEGFDLVGEAETGEEAVEMVSQLVPDLILMDINMPGIDGLEATRRIVAAHPEVRVVVLSTYEAGEYEARALAAGAAAFVAKSEFDPSRLGEVWALARSDRPL